MAGAAGGDGSAISTSGVSINKIATNSAENFKKPKTNKNKTNKREIASCVCVCVCVCVKSSVDDKLEAAG